MTWRVEGMFCPHCEQTILGALSSLPGLSNVRVSYRASTISADWDRALLSEKQLADILANHGYTLKAPRSPLRDALGFAGGVAALILLFFAVDRSPLGTWIAAFPTAKAGMSLGALFLVGLMTSLHCVAMCGGIAAQQVVTRLREEQRAHDKPLVPVLPRVAEPTQPQHGGKSTSKEDMGIKIAGLPGCQVHFAKCCTPLPGDEIIGYITRGRGVTIHSKECVNVNASHDPARWVEAEWSDTVNSSYNGSIQILAQDRHNLLADLMSYLSAQKVTVCALNAKVNSNQTCSIELTLQVANKQELDWVIKQIAKRQDTIEIFRV